MKIVEFTLDKELEDNERLEIMNKLIKNNFNYWKNEELLEGIKDKYSVIMNIQKKSQKNAQISWDSV